MVTRGWDGEEPAKQIIGPRSDNESTEEVEIVDILRSDGDWSANGADETDDVDENPGDVSGIASPVETEPEVVGTGRLCAVEFCDLKVPLPNDVVITDDDASDG